MTFGAFGRRGQKLMGLVFFSLFFLSAEKNTDYIFFSAATSAAKLPPSFFLQHLPFTLRSLLLLPFHPRFKVEKFSKMFFALSRLSITRFRNGRIGFLPWDFYYVSGLVSDV